MFDSFRDSRSGDHSVDLADRDIPAGLHRNGAELPGKFPQTCRIVIPGISDAVSLPQQDAGIGIRVGIGQPDDGEFHFVFSSRTGFISVSFMRR